MAVVVAIVTTVVLGIPIALALDRNARGPILVGLAYLYGTGLIYVVELALALIGVHWTALNVNAVTITIAAICFFARKPQSLVLSPQPWLSWPDLATLLTIYAHLTWATIARVWKWDFWAIWGMKARTFYEFGTIDWRFLESQWNGYVHPDYPLLLPMNYLYTALVGGEWNDRWLGLITIAFGVALLLIIRGLAAMETRPVMAATITFACALFAFTRFIGLAEGPMLAFAGAGLLFVRRAIVFDDDAAMRHGALLLGLATASKNEGVALLVTVVAAVALSKWRLLARLWPVFVLAAAWIIIPALHHIRNDQTRGNFVARVFHRLGAFPQIAAMLLHFLAFRWMWLAVLVALLIVPRQLRARERFVLLAFAFQIAGYVIIYCGTPYSVEWEIESSWPRLTFHLATPLLYVTMLMLAQTYDSGHAEARSEQH